MTKTNDGKKTKKVASTARNSGSELARKSREQHEWPRRSHAQRHAVQQLTIGQPVILRDCSA